MVGWMPGFFDIEERLRELSAKGDDLECIKGLVDFGKFRADLEAAVPRADRSRGGRPPFDHVLMFKVLILIQQGQAEGGRRASGRSGHSGTMARAWPMCWTRST